MTPLRCEWSGGVTLVPSLICLGLETSAMLIFQAQLRDRCLLPLRLAFA